MVNNYNTIIHFLIFKALLFKKLNFLKNLILLVNN